MQLLLIHTLRAKKLRTMSKMWQCLQKDLFVPFNDETYQSLQRNRRQSRITRETGGAHIAVGLKLSSRDVRDSGIRYCRKSWRRKTLTFMLLMNFRHRQMLSKSLVEPTTYHVERSRAAGLLKFVTRYLGEEFQVAVLETRGGQRTNRSRWYRGTNGPCPKTTRK